MLGPLRFVRCERVSGRPWRSSCAIHAGARNGFREHAIGLLMPPTVVITGASSGIGEALALRYASERARLGLLGRNRERLDRVAAECRRHGAEAHVAAIDVR